MTKPEFSFEFFPPNTEKMTAALWRAVEALAPLAPRFVSVTYGAGGSTRERTHATVERIHQEAGLAVAAHLTCVAASREEVDAVADRYWEMGVRHIVALRGDMPEAGAPYRPHQQGYGFAADLVAGLKAQHDFEISVAAYPETHPEAQGPQDEIDNLKRKRDAGATRAITQFFFETDDFLRYRDRLTSAGVDFPIVPGVLPIANYKSMTGFAARCGARVPAWVGQRFEGLEDDADGRRAAAVTIAADQCRTLMAEGIDAFHFYTLNRAELTAAVCAEISC